MNLELVINKIVHDDMLNNIGDDKFAMTLWFAGCSFRCEGCHNEHLWDHTNGTHIHIDKLLDKLFARKQLYDYNYIVLLGGEPLEQNMSALFHFCRYANHHFKIFLYTGFDFNDIPDAILNHIDMVKTGTFDINLITTNRVLASSNQKLYKKIDKEWKEITHEF